MAEQNVNLNGGAAAPPTDAISADISTDIDFVCKDCRKSYRTLRGLNQHRRLRHEEMYHAENVPVPRVKARWDHEELVLLAREELRLTALGVRFINKGLQAFMPGRSLEAIKGIRKKSNNSSAYHGILETLANHQAGGVAQDAPSSNASALRVGNGGVRTQQVENVIIEVQNDDLILNEELRNENVTITNVNEHDELESPQWNSVIVDEIRHYKYEVDVDVETICPGLPTESGRGRIDDDFAAWLSGCDVSRADEVRDQPLMDARSDDDPAVRTCPGRQVGGVRRPSVNVRSDDDPVGLACASSQVRGDRCPSVPDTPPNRLRTSDRARKRRADYARVQSLFCKNKSRCAQRVLDGTWSAAKPQLSLSELEPFWRSVFEKESVADCRRPEPIGPVIWEIVRPVLMPELEQTIAEMKPGAPGPDGMVLGSFKRLPRVALRARYNLWLLAGYCPTTNCRGETVLIVKDQNDLVPPKHRPITMADLIIRCFHKLMAKRLGALLPFSDRQKAFRKGDGLAENVLLLNAIIDSHKKTLTPLNVVFLDIIKAFDSVSHDTILIAAKRMGVPPPFIGYLREYYARSTTVIRVGGRRGSPITVRQGVKQGDPMSVHLFNAVIDWALDDLDPELGIVIQGLRVNHLAFADDIVLLTRTSIAAQNQLDRITSHLELAGLRVSAGDLGKSASIRIDIDGKKKKWVVNPSAHLHVANEKIPARSISQAYKYLGINFSAKGTACDVRAKLQSWLDNISKAPLKPQQRMYILRVHLIPGLYHQLVLARTTTGQLKFLDLKIRGAIKNWLKLPKDTVNPYFYAATKDGGLGVINLRFTIPLMRKSRLESIVCSSDPAIAAVALTPYVCDALVKLSVPQTLGNTVITDKRSLARAFSSALHATVDGFGLSSCSLAPKLHSWIETPGHLMSGANYIGAIKIRGNLMPSAARTSRGRPLASDRCDSCRRRGTLAHVLQVCPRTFGPRIDRHDTVVNRTVKELLKRGWTVLVEPAISTPAGLRRPDLVVWRHGQKAYVIDATIVADHANLYEAHESKVTYYSDRRIAEWVIGRAGTNDVKISSISFNWRGAIAPPSYTLLKDLGMSERFVAFLSVCVLEKGFHSWLHYSKSTYREPMGEYTSPGREGIG